MKQEHKDLLLKDLCARLPYGIKCYISELNDYRVLGSVQYDSINTLFDFWNKEQIRYEFQLYISEFKPYLFPLSSMTKEQTEELESLMEIITIPAWGEILSPTSEYYDFLNKNHFDYRGLIEKGLAIDVTGLNIY